MVILASVHESLGEVSVALPPHSTYQIGIMPPIGENFQSRRSAPSAVLQARHADFLPTHGGADVGRDARDIANELIDSFSGSGEVDMVADFTLRYPYIVIARLL